MSLFIAIEGIDGVGKSTASHAVKEFFESLAMPCLLTREPYASPTPKLLSENTTPSSLCKAFIDDRRAHIDTCVVPFLQSGSHVVTDRYYYSNAAYQACDELTMEQILELNAEFPVPDVLILMDADPEDCLCRIVNRGGVIDAFEQNRTLQKIIRNRFRQMVVKHPCAVIIDASQSIENVTKSIQSYLKFLFENVLNRSFLDASKTCSMTDETFTVTLNQMPYVIKSNDESVTITKGNALFWDNHDVYSKYVDFQLPHTTDTLCFNRKNKCTFLSQMNDETRSALISLFQKYVHEPYGSIIQF